ncbi:serine proteinase [Apostichopus japonicus]|uniref:Serine proteinase n=1 Tax=Stichopus japonicus TaxID=307972 RepID=A0A2G8K8K1_STIJA|nr:serine proteinase [Apostichopus japonicus]
MLQPKTCAPTLDLCSNLRPVIQPKTCAPTQDLCSNPKHVLLPMFSQMQDLIAFNAIALSNVGLLKPCNGILHQLKLSNMKWFIDYVYFDHSKTVVKDSFLGVVSTASTAVALNGFAATLAPKALELVRRFNFVKYVEEDQIMRIDAVASWVLTELTNKTYLLITVSLQEPLTRNCNPWIANDGEGVNVYVIDTGINPTHVDFGGRAYTEASMDFVSINRGGVDCNGHGSHCAGTVAVLLMVSPTKPISLESEYLAV